MKRLVHNLKSMCSACRWLLKGGLMITCALLLGSILLMARAGGWTLDTYYLIRSADSMREIAAVVLFLTVIGSAWWEERYRKTAT